MLEIITTLGAETERQRAICIYLAEQKKAALRLRQGGRELSRHGEKKHQKLRQVSGISHKDSTQRYPRTP